MSEGFEKILHHNAPAGCPAVRANPAKFINYINNLGADHGRRITDSRFSAESLFGFDRSQLRPEGMATLDGFARDAAGTNFESVVVHGFADRTGPADYNQALSLARAEAVKAYLVSKGGFDANRITTAGMGETQPVTKPGDCPATLTGDKLNACLQPDRRVDVELSGTR